MCTACLYWLSETVAEGNWRDVFRTRREPKVRPFAGNPHKTVAGQRAAVVAWTKKFIEEQGKEVYDLTTRDSDGRESGAHFWRKLRDLFHEPKMDSLEDNHVMVLVDSEIANQDALNTLLAMASRVVFVISHNILTAGKTTGELPYAWLPDDSVELRPAGGSEYKIKLWNMSVDHILVRGWVVAYPVATLYKVESRAFWGDCGRLVTMFLPVRRWAGLAALTVRERPLEQRKAVHFLAGPGSSQVAMVQVQTESGITVSVADVREGGVRPEAATIPASVYNGLDTRATTATNKLSEAEIKSRLHSEAVAVPASAISVLAKVVNAKVKFNNVPLIAENNVLVKYFESATFADDSKTTMIEFMKPFVVGASLVHMQGLATEKTAVIARVLNVRSGAGLSARSMAIAKGFVWCLREHMSNYGIALLSPVGYDEVRERQARENQRRILDQGMTGHYARGGAASFVKKEPYKGLGEEVKPPRLITTINATNKVEWSRYQYAFSALMKTLSWYAFGYAPAEVARGLAKMCQKCVDGVALVEGDARYYDGRISPGLRKFSQMVYLAVFRPEHADAIADLCRAMTNLRAHTAEGYEYQTKSERLSGEPGTSNENTLDNAFCSFHSLIDHYHPTASPSEIGSHAFQANLKAAWKALGKYGGDDSITPVRDVAVATTMSNTYALLGQQLKVVVRERETGYPTFLNRVYGPALWHGEVDSITDVHRAIIKFHLSVNQQADPVAYCVTKAYSYWLSDRNTPILGRIVGVVKKYAEFAGISWGHHVESAATYNTLKYKPDVQYPNEYRDWMADVVRETCDHWNIEKIDQWAARVRKARKEGDFVAAQQALLTPDPLYEHEVALGGAGRDGGTIAVPVPEVIPPPGESEKEEEPEVAAPVDPAPGTQSQGEVAGPVLAKKRGARRGRRATRGG